MAWENEGRYYTRSKRVGGRVVREYIGGGEVGHFIADGDWLERVERKAEAAAKKATRDSDRAQEKTLTDYYKAVDVALAEALIAAGYHKHKGQWRRRRGTRECSSEPGEL